MTTKETNMDIKMLLQQPPLFCKVFFKDDGTWLIPLNKKIFNLFK